MYNIFYIYRKQSNVDAFLSNSKLSESQMNSFEEKVNRRLELMNQNNNVNIENDDDDNEFGSDSFLLAVGQSNKKSNNGKSKQNVTDLRRSLLKKPKNLMQVSELSKDAHVEQHALHNLHEKLARLERENDALQTAMRDLIVNRDREQALIDKRHKKLVDKALYYEKLSRATKEKFDHLETITTRKLNALQSSCEENEKK